MKVDTVFEVNVSEYISGKQRLVYCESGRFTGQLPAQVRGSRISNKLVETNAKRVRIQLNVKSTVLYTSRWLYWFPSVNIYICIYINTKVMYSQLTSTVSFSPSDR